MGGLAADAWFADPRVAEAKRLLRAALEEHAGGIAGPRGPDPALEAGYEETIARLAEARGAALVYPYLASGLGRGALVELADGSVKYDFISGIGVHYFGHSHPAMLEAGLEGALRDAVTQGNLQQDRVAAEVVELFLRAANHGGGGGEGGFAHCFLTSSGAMANENALKLAFQKRQPADRILAFEGCFAGRTMVLSQVTDKPAFRVGLPDCLAVDYIPFFDPGDPVGSRDRARSALQGHLRRHPGRHAALIFEPILGEGGYHPGDPGFFRAVLGAAREQGVIIIADEIQTFGRTPAPFAFRHFGLADLVDAATVGKLTQVCATVYRPALKPGPGLLSQTFIASSAALCAGRTALRALLDGDFLGPEGRIARLSARFARGLEGLRARYPGSVAGPFGYGALLAFTPLGGDEARVRDFARDLFRRGLIGLTAGSRPTRLRFAPPIGALGEADIDAALSLLDGALAAAGEPAPPGRGNGQVTTP